MPVCFFITPFSEDSAGGEDQEVFEAVQDAVRTASNQAGVELRRADDIFAAGVVIDQVRGEIERADLIVAVCTGRNANVFYELGLAEAMGHRPILVAASATDLPFDVQHWRAQLYGPPHSVEGLADRVALAMAETREATPPTHAPVDEPAQAAAVGDSALDLIRADDFPGFTEEAKRLVNEAGNAHEEVALENRGAKPTQDTLAELETIRYPAVETLLNWLVPALEYRPEWIERPLEMLRTWFWKAPGGERSGYEFWTNVHQTWTSLALKTLVGVAVAYQQSSALRLLVSLSGEGSYEPAPLLINPAMTWAKGYHGNSAIAFADFEKYSAGSGVVARVLEETGIESPLHLACGIDLVLGIGRCVVEAREVNIATEPAGSRHPRAYAAFAAYYCDYIVWACSQLESREDLAVALGAESLDTFRSIARAWYPRLAERTDKFTHTCVSWEQTVS